MQSLTILLSVVAAVMALFVLQSIQLQWVMRWTDRRTEGVRYCGLPAAQRVAFKRTLRAHAWMLTPIRSFLSHRRTSGGKARFRFEDATFRYQGIPGPCGACSPQSFERGAEYLPTSEDVFVVTQMRSGTTWMQHLVYQVLTRGQTDLVAEDRCLNAISPWLESTKTVTVTDAPLVGDKVRKRIIKTHFPDTLCPFSPKAKYIHVVRNPLSCFASSVDFVRSNLQGFEPDWETCLDWFLSPEWMWWSTWTDHFSGWQQRSSEPHVLLVTFEEMKENLGAVAQRVADFLGVENLSELETNAIVQKCSFQYMQRNRHIFEMHPPHLLQIPGRFFVSGRTDYGTMLPESVRQRLAAWCLAEDVAHGGFFAEYYPEVFANVPRPCGETSCMTRASLP